MQIETDLFLESKKGIEKYSLVMLMQALMGLGQTRLDLYLGPKLVSTQQGQINIQIWIHIDQADPNSNK